MTRLIDADGLKNTFWHGDLVPNKEMYHISEIKYAIDNAPTVTDVIPNEEGYEMYSKGYTLGKEKGKNERPHGEWIIDGHHIRCNRCNEYICNTDREGNEIPDNYCPNCGDKV